MPENILVTGANRGIGLAITKVLLSQGDQVFAACRQPQQASELQTLKKLNPGKLEILAMGVDSDQQVEAASKEAAQKVQHLDILFNNAGISPPPFDSSLEKVELQKCREAFEVNVLGPMRVTRAFLPLLRKSAKPRVVNSTSGLASLAGKNEGHFYAYGVSKAALNMVTRTMAFEFKGENIIVVCMDPGRVRTDMGGPNASLAPEESASAIVKMVKGLTMAQTSLFLYNDGNPLKW